jgi:hypothetical protein
MDRSCLSASPSLTIDSAKSNSTSDVSPPYSHFPQCAAATAIRADCSKLPTFLDVQDEQSRSNHVEAASQAAKVHLWPSKCARLAHYIVSNPTRADSYLTAVCPFRRVPLHRLRTAVLRDNALWRLCAERSDEIRTILFSQRMVWIHNGRAGGWCGIQAGR